MSLPRFGKYQYQFLLSALYGVPFLLVLLFDLGIGRTQYSFPNDQISSFYGLGLNILEGHFFLFFHQPAFTGMELAAVAEFLAHPTQSLDGFFHIGQAENMVLAGIAASIMGALAARAAVKPWQVLLLSVAAASMPTVALFTSMLGGYFLSGVFLPPLAMGLWLLAQPGALPRWVPQTTFALMGLELANMFPALILVVTSAVMLSILWVSYGTQNLVERLGGYQPPSKFVRLAVFALTFLFLWQILILLSGMMDGRLTERWRWPLAAAATIGIAALPSNWRGLWCLIRSAYLPLLGGWATAANMYAPRWGKSAVGAFLNKGSASPHLPMHEVLRQLDIVGYLNAWSWHWLFAVSALGGFAVVVLGLFVKPLRGRGAILVAAMAVLCLILNGIIAADVSFLAGTPPQGYGQATRYMLMGIVPVILMAIVGLRAQRWVAALTTAAILSCGFFSIMEYRGQSLPMIADSDNAEENLERAIAAHLAASDQNIVWCLRSIMPKSCEILFGRNNYRASATVQSAELTELEGGRIRYADDLPSARAQTPDATKNLYILDGGQAGADDVVVWHGDRGFAFRQRLTP